MTRPSVLARRDVTRPIEGARSAQVTITAIEIVPTGRMIARLGEPRLASTSEDQGEQNYVLSRNTRPLAGNRKSDSRLELRRSPVMPGRVYVPHESQRPAIGYIRVSTEAQQDDLEKQAERLRVKGAERQLAVVEIYDDVGSGRGSDGLKRRPGLRTAVHRAAAGGFPLVVTDIERIARDPETVRQIVKDMGVEVYTLDGDLRWAVQEPHSQRGREFGDRVQAGTRNALAARKRSGRSLGNTTNRLEAARSGAKANAIRAELVVRDIADVLRRVDPGRLLRLREVVDLLNLRGVLTGRGLPWTLRAAEVPVRRAREQLELEGEIERTETWDWVTGASKSDDG
jgi:hypothetical protein